MSSPALPLVPLYYELDDGRSGYVTADQRDQRRAVLVCGIPDPEADPFGFTRAMAWSAATRTGVLEISWRDFDLTCPGVVPAPTNGEEPPTLDPTPGDGAALSPPLPSA